jgi:hypothetical protein
VLIGWLKPSDIASGELAAQNRTTHETVDEEGEGRFLILEYDDGYMHGMRGAGVAGGRKKAQLRA